MSDGSLCHASSADSQIYTQNGLADGNEFYNSIQYSMPLKRRHALLEADRSTPPSGDRPITPGGDRPITTGGDGPIQVIPEFLIPSMVVRARAHAPLSMRLITPDIGLFGGCTLGDAVNKLLNGVAAGTTGHV